MDFCSDKLNILICFSLSFNIANKLKGAILLSEVCVCFPSFYSEEQIDGTMMQEVVVLSLRDNLYKFPCASNPGLPLWPYKIQVFPYCCAHFPIWPNLISFPTQTHHSILCKSCSLIRKLSFGFYFLWKHVLHHTDFKKIWLPLKKTICPIILTIGD